MSSAGSDGPKRLVPEMSSRRLQVMDFIRDYIAGHNDSPSIREIAAGCGIEKSAAHQHVRSLIRAGHLVGRQGVRGLMLPSAIEEAKRRLREAGYCVDEDFTPQRTNSKLLPLPALDYPERRSIERSVGDGDGGNQLGAATSRQSG